MRVTFVAPLTGGVMDALVDFVLNARPPDSYPRFQIRSTTPAIAVNLPRAIEDVRRGGMATRWADLLTYRNWDVFHMSRRLWRFSAQKVLSSIDNKIAEGLASHAFLHRYTARDRVFRGCTNGIGSVETRRVQDA